MLLKEHNLGFINKLKITLIVLLGIIAGCLLVLDKVTPDTPFIYGVKRAQEKSYLKLKSPQDKVDYYNYLLNRRLKELDYAVKTKDYNLIVTSSLRYSATAGELTDTILNNNLLDKVENIKVKLAKHKLELTNLSETYPRGGAEEWKFVQDGVNYLNMNLHRLSEL